MLVLPCCVFLILLNVGNLAETAAVANDPDTLMERVKILEVCKIHQLPNCFNNKIAFP